VFFFASFVFPCPMIYFGMNCNQCLWNPWCCSFAFPPLFLCTLSTDCHPMRMVVALEIGLFSPFSIRAIQDFLNVLQTSSVP